MENELWVYTFKQGLLSRIAHDLKVKATAVQWAYEPSTQQWTLKVPSDGLRVECAMQAGVEAASVLSASDKAQIEKNIRQEVLESNRFPVIEFTGREEPGGIVSGVLRLHGVQKECRIPFRTQNGLAIAEWELDQRDFGIKPYTAMMGALKVAPAVKVVVQVKRAAQSQ